MISKQLKDILSKSDRYSEFIILDEEKPFNEFFKDKDFDYVQLHSSQIFDEHHIFGFAGVFNWKNNNLKSLDGDYYSDDMSLIGYNYFDNPEEGIYNGLEILV